MSGKNGGPGPSAIPLAPAAKKSELELAQPLPPLEEATAASATQLRRLHALMLAAVQTLFRESEAQSRLFNQLVKTPPLQVFWNFDQIGFIID